MILVTGGTGFIGTSLIRHLAEQNEPVRILLKPSKTTPNIPKGVPVEVAVSSLSDERGLRAAMRNIDTIIHLASSERRGSLGDLNAIDVEGTNTLIAIANQANVKRILFLSHLGADKASGYPVLRAKGFAETTIIESGMQYLIFRLGNVFGPGDQFTVPIKKLIKISPIIFMLPSNGDSLLQPLWIEDLITVLTWSLQEENIWNRTISIGGIDQLSYRSIIETLLKVIHRKRFLAPISSAYARPITLMAEQLLGKFPISMHWLDTLAADRTCAVDNLPRLFGLMPARFAEHLDYLKD